MLHLHAAILLAEASWKGVLGNCQPLQKELTYHELASQEVTACLQGSFAQDVSWLWKVKVEVASDSCGTSARIFLFSPKANKKKC